jgi:hypothetical protein
MAEWLPVKPALTDAIRYAWDAINASPMPANLSPIYYPSANPKIAKAHLVGRVKRAARKAGRA